MQARCPYQPNFADVARLIVPENRPKTLPAFLEWFSQGVRHDRMAARYQSKGQLQSLAHIPGGLNVKPIALGMTEVVRRGRRQDLAYGELSAKTLLAARILLMWLMFRKSPAGPFSPNASKAANAFWVASGGSNSTADDPLKNWYRQFAFVRNNEFNPVMIFKRAGWEREISEFLKRGRPPWCLGNYNPVSTRELISYGSVD